MDSKPNARNALIIWREPESGALRLAETSCGWCYPPRPADSCWDVGVACGVDEVLDVTAADAAERVLCLAEPGRPRVGDRVEARQGLAVRRRDRHL